MSHAPPLPRLLAPFIGALPLFLAASGCHDPSILDSAFLDTAQNGTETPTCELKLRDLRSDRDEFDGDYVNAVGVDFTSQVSQAVESLEATLSWYEGAVTTTIQLDPEIESTRIGPLPYALDTHFLQAYSHDQGEEPQVEVTVEARQGTKTLCQAQTSLPFSQWNRPTNLDIHSSLSLADTLSMEALESSFQGTLALQTVTGDTEGTSSFIFLRTLLGDILAVYPVDEDTVREVASEGNEITNDLNSADFVGGDLVLATEGVLNLNTSILMRFDPFGGGLQAAFDTSEYTGDYDGELALHNKLYVDSSGAMHALDWRYRSDTTPPLGTNLVELELDYDSLEVLDLREIFHAGHCSQNSEYDYGNAVGLGATGCEGQRYQVVTFAIDNNARGETEKSFFVAGLPGEVPAFIFAREGLTSSALSEGCWEAYPEIQAVEIPDLPDGQPVMDFLHDASLRRVASDRYQVAIYSLGSGDRTGFLAVFDLEVPSTAQPEEPLTAEFVCAYELNEDPTAHGNLYTLPLEWYDPDFAMTYLFPGKSGGPIRGFLHETDGSGSCAAVFEQTDELADSSGSSDDSHYSAKWLEPFGDHDLESAERIDVEVVYDLSLLEQSAEDLDLYF